MNVHYFSFRFSWKHMWCDGFMHSKTVTVLHVPNKTKKTVDSLITFQQMSLQTYLFPVTGHMPML